MSPLIDLTPSRSSPKTINVRKYLMPRPSKRDDRTIGRKLKKLHVPEDPCSKNAETAKPNLFLASSRRGSVFVELYPDKVVLSRDSCIVSL